MSLPPRQVECPKGGVVSSVVCLVSSVLVMSSVLLSLACVSAHSAKARTIRVSACKSLSGTGYTFINKQSGVEENSTRNAPRLSTRVEEMAKCLFPLHFLSVVSCLSIYCCFKCLLLCKANSFQMIQDSTGSTVDF